jgi:hypothetical protein
LTHCKVQAGLPGLDEGIELLGQEPEAMGTLQAMAPSGGGDAIEVVRRPGVRQCDQGLESQESAGQAVKQEMTCTVAKDATHSRTVERAGPEPGNRFSKRPQPRPTIRYRETPCCK